MIKLATKLLDRGLVKRQYCDAAVVIAGMDEADLDSYRRLAIASYAFCPVCLTEKPVSPATKGDTINGHPSGITDDNIHWLCLVCKHEFHNLSEVYIRIHGIKYGSVLDGGFIKDVV